MSFVYILYSDYVRRPDPDDDYSGVRNPAPVVAAADEKGNVGCGKCPKKEK